MRVVTEPSHNPHTPHRGGVRRHQAANGLYLIATEDR
jgi:hypothetical protein